MTGPISLRAASKADVPACLDIFYAAGDELAARNGQPLWPRNPGPLGSLFEHLIETDPQRAWVAERSADWPIAFGLAHRREDSWFLAFLFVRPEHQSAGVGRRLVDACLGRDRPRHRGVCAESTQPISLGLYARYGMLPRVPIFALRGRMTDGRPGMAPSDDITLEPFSGLETGHHAQLTAQVDGIDRAVLGYARPVDHRFWRLAERQGYLLRASASSDPIGYGYVHPAGRLGPVAVTDPSVLAPAVERLSTLIDPPDSWQVFVPGPSPALVPLFGAGLHIDEHAVLYAADREGLPAWDRYLPANYAIL